MAIGTASGVEITQVNTTQQAPLGFEVVVPDGDNGEQTWVYVFNDEASTAFAAGDLIQLDTDYVPYHGIVSAGAALVRFRVLGAAQHAIAAGSYGFILKKGKGLAKGDGSVAQGESIVSHTSGQVDTMGSGEEQAIIGMALAADGSAGDTFSVFLDCGV